MYLYPSMICRLRSIHVYYLWRYPISTISPWTRSSCHPPHPYFLIFDHVHWAIPITLLHTPLLIVPPFPSTILLYLCLFLLSSPRYTFHLLLRLILMIYTVATYEPSRTIFDVPLSHSIYTSAPRLSRLMHPNCFYTSVFIYIYAFFSASVSAFIPASVSV